MKKVIQNPLLYFIAASLAIVALFFVDQKTDKDSLIKQEQKLGRMLQKHLIDKRTQAETIFKQNGLEEALLQYQQKSAVLRRVSDQNFYLLCFKKDSLYFWNTNEAVLDSSITKIQDTTAIVKLGKNIYLVCSRQIGDLKCLLLYHAGSETESSELPGDHPFYESQGYIYEIEEVSPGYKMQWANGQFMATFNLVDIERINNFWVWAGLFMLVFISFFIYKYVELSGKNGLSWQGFGIYASLVIVLRALLYKRTFLSSLLNSEIFNPEIYASSFLLPSLGDLVLHSLSFLVLFYGFSKIKNLNLHIPGSRFAFLKSTALCLAFAFSTDLVFAIIKSLVVDSNISFHFADLQKINIYSFIGMTIIGVLMGSLFYIFNFLFDKTGFRYIPKKVRAWSLAASLIFFALFQTFDGHQNWVPITATVSLCISVVMWFVFKPSIRDFYLNILVLLVISGYSAFIINYNNKRHEREYLNVFVNKIVSNQDLEAESKFASMEKELVKEFITPQDFQEFFRRQEEYEKRIKNLFFSGYLDKFELKILSFDSTGKSINLDTRFSYRFLDKIYAFHSFPTISNHFYQIKNKAGVRGYIAKFETCNLAGNYGTVFLLLQPKIIQSSHSYPDIFDDKKQQSVFDFKDYSYAIYQGSKLLGQKGDYPYRLAIPFKGRESDYFPSGGYSHFVNSPQPDITVMISKRHDYLVKSFALFSFMFIFFTILGVVFALLWTTIYIARFGWQKFTSKHRGNTPILDLLSRTVPLISPRQRLLSSRIQVSMVGLVFFGLIVSVFFTIQYVRYNYNERQQDQLFLNLKEILNQLENEPDLPRKLKNNDRLRALVNQLSDANRIDLNIFDASGLLLASTQPTIYTQYLLAPLMHPDAIFRLRAENASQLLQNEKVTNFEYLSGYVPLFNDEGRIIAYLNLPYFTEKSEIDKEISSFLVSLINIYFLLLLIAIIIAYFIGQRISLPLQLIREKLSKTSISSKNETIEWRRDDEIGQLVKQYNKMVLELEESAHKLTESEREGAWKEMARQVAHEIKNPLTPMKLNIQHLQRAWKNNPEQLDQTFKKVTEILIEQIDSLSRLATEFSSFAKMPTDQFANCRIDEILLSTIHLFEQSENIDFVYDKNPPETMIYTDPEQIRRVFTNIFKNAIQSIPSERDGIITVQYELKSKEVVICIKDNGMGIGDELKAKIFIPSFSTKNSGMGLGLAIAKKIVENSKGKIWFQSAKGKGSEFFVSLPLSERWS